MSCRLLCLLFLLLSSCRIYDNCFDCPPGRGLPCKSVTEIEELIIETEQGQPDHLKGECEEECSCVSVKKVWIAPTASSEELCQSGYYVFERSSKE